MSHERCILRLSEWALMASLGVDANCTPVASSPWESRQTLENGRSNRHRGHPDWGVLWDGRNCLGAA